MAKESGAIVVEDLEGVGEVAAIVSTVPGAAGMQVPAALLEGKPAVLDAAYRPATTALMSQALEAGCPCGQGADMLVEQGVAAWERWTERRAPRAVMRAAVMANCEDIVSQPRLARLAERLGSVAEPGTSGA